MDPNTSEEPAKKTFVWPETVKENTPVQPTSDYSAPLPLPENPYAATSLDIEPDAPGKSYIATWLLAWLVPGIELIYLGYIARGIIKFITFGGLGVWTIISLIYLFAGKTTSKDGRPVEGRRKYLALSLIVTILITAGQLVAIGGLVAAGALLAPQTVTSAQSELETSIDNLNAVVANTPKDAAIAEKATTIQKIAKEYNTASPAAAPSYPTKTEQFSTTDIPLPKDTTVSGIDPTAANGVTTIGYQYVKSKAGADGARVTYWDYSKDSLAEPLYIGAISSNSVYTALAN